MNLDFFDRTIQEWIAPGIFFGAVVFELFFLLVFYLRLLFLKKSTEAILEKPVSVCLCVRNEEDRVERVLIQLLEQKYANFEVVVVDDFSEDCTIQKVAQLAKKYPQLKFTSISQETNFSEKLAINLAMKAANSECVLFLQPDTDAIDPLFLKKINDNIGESNLLLNYTNLVREQKLRNKLCRLEYFHSFLTSAAYSLNGVSVFYQEPNVLFSKSIYFEKSGFRGKMNYHFANLELVFNNHFKKKICVSVDPETTIREKSELTTGEFAELLRKRIRLNLQLGFGKRMLHFIENLSKWLFAGSLIWMLTTELQYWLFISFPAIVVFAFQLFIVKTMSARLKEEKIFLSSFMYIYIRQVLNLYQVLKIYIHDKRNKWN